VHRAAFCSCRRAPSEGVSLVEQPSILPAGIPARGIMAANAESELSVVRASRRHGCAALAAHRGRCNASVMDLCPTIPKRLFRSSGQVLSAEGSIFASLSVSSAGS
jgi:hypothetical protein